MVEQEHSVQTTAAYKFCHNSEKIHMDTGKMRPFISQAELSFFWELRKQDCTVSRMAWRRPIIENKRVQTSVNGSRYGFCC